MHCTKNSAEFEFGSRSSPPPMWVGKISAGYLVKFCGQNWSKVKINSRKSSHIYHNNRFHMTNRPAPQLPVIRRWLWTQVDCISPVRGSAVCEALAERRARQPRSVPRADLVVWQRSLDEEHGLEDVLAPRRPPMMLTLWSLFVRLSQSTDSELDQ